MNKLRSVVENEEIPSSSFCTPFFFRRIDWFTGDRRSVDELQCVVKNEDMYWLVPFSFFLSSDCCRQEKNGRAST